MVHWGCFAGFGECCVERSHSCGCGSVEGIRTQEEERFWTKEDLSSLAGRKIPTEESVNSREVVGVLISMLADELHKIIETLLWGTIPSWRPFRQVHPPGLGHLRLYSLLSFWDKGSLPTPSQGNGPWAPEPISPVMNLKPSEPEDPWKEPCKFTDFFPIQVSFFSTKSSWRSSISITCCHQINLDIFSWLYSLFEHNIVETSGCPPPPHLVSTSSKIIQTQCLTGTQSCLEYRPRCTAFS